MRQLFFYGTLRDTNLLAVVLGRAVEDLDLVPAVLPGFEACAVKGQTFPFARRTEGHKAPGLLARGLTDPEIERLCFYEGAYLYGLSPQPVLVNGQEQIAEVFLSDHTGWEPDGTWDLDRWMAADKGVAAEAAIEAMAFMGERPADDVHTHFNSIRLRAQARLTARVSAPVNLRRGLRLGDAQTVALRRPYLKFFSVEERDIRFQKYNGKSSSTVERAVFMSADAATVLPYDPVNDLVLLIEQFRAGPYCRGDQNPWLLEPIAGRCDLGESFADTARRECVEEAGLALTGLEKIASYYTSPGAYSEYIHSFIGIADLKGHVEAVHGVADEHEDIRSFAVPFTALMQAVADGEADNGPLLVSAMWLAANRDRLRAKYANA